MDRRAPPLGDEAAQRGAVAEEPAGIDEQRVERACAQLDHLVEVGIVESAPPTKSRRVASAVNDATREIGAAIGNAVAGSVLAAAYRDALAPTIGALPTGAREAATDSLASAQGVAEKLGPRAAGLVNLAEAAFTDAMSQALYGMSAALLAAAVLVAVLSPGRNGKQWSWRRRRKERHRST